MSALTSPVSSDDWDRHWGAHAASNALNPAQAYRRSLIFEALGLSQAARPLRLIEFGCGQGELSSEIATRHPEAELVGVDLSETGIAIARAKVPGAQFFRQNLTQPFADRYRGWASHAVCSEVLEHLDDPLTALRNLRACLAPRGSLVITVPGGPMSAFDRHLGHRAHFTQARLRQLLLDAGFEDAAVQGAGFPFFNLYRMTVIARGRRLITDAQAAPSRLARLAIWTFSRLFRLNSTESSLGWQLVAVARQPLSSALELAASNT